MFQYSSLIVDRSFKMLLFQILYNLHLGTLFSDFNWKWKPKNWNWNRNIFLQFLWQTQTSCERDKMTEKLSLSWNDFNQNVSKTFSSLRHQEDFYDVTLVSDDQEQFSAHKVVLSACSDYFGNTLKKNKHTHPLLCLEGVSSSELNCLLDYVYNGQAQLLQEDLDKFLKIAQRFQLKGLLQRQRSSFQRDSCLKPQISWSSSRKYFPTFLTSSDKDLKVMILHGMTGFVKGP